MIFSIVIIVAVLGLAYMHMLQGAFTSAISMACAVAATLVAFGYYENVVNMMPQNGFADYGGSMALVILFVVTYAILRVLADMLIPGNISLQLYVEKATSVICGLVAGVLAAGTFAVAVQMMPLGAAVAGYAPYEIGEDRQVVVPAALMGKQRGVDTFVFNEVVPDKYDTPGGMLLPADGFVLSLVKLTSAGAFSGGQSFASIHPDLPTEAFGSRAGADQSTKHVVLNSSKQTNATFGGLYALSPSVSALDAEVVDMRPKKTSLTFKPSGTDQLVVVRVQFGDSAADKDSYVRLTPGSARLVVNGETYYPIGSMEGSHIGLNRLDDQLPVLLQSGANGVDLVYSIPKSAADTLAKPLADESAVRFIEIKLFGRIDLSDKKIEPYPGPSKSIKVLRKPTSPLGLVTKANAAS